ncbi:unnamed protein product [Peronospora farinosa]|uniref:OTU domain-containing protein 1 n=1 Tax=Peronospora farinosa TaxID=134698 RepID=A0AAV0TZC4_9STRA|nr:unnamed protein product [Peronospora farinosa]CAI5728350.1 unnamed protein product [Peronospora farinosa]
MSLAWLRNHARNRHRGITRTRSNSQRLVATMQAHRQFASTNEAHAFRVTYDSSFVVDSSVTSRDANWISDEQYKRQYFRLGWKVTPIRKDGNCLFRALSDQLYGHERRHLELRRRLVDFIDLERAFFEPLLGGQGGIIEYCSRLREAGASGGQSELLAASRLLGVNIIVHTGPVKRLHFDTDKYARTKEGKGKTINLLLQHEHYSSLRKSAKPLHQQHGCSDTCLCKRLVTPSRASLDSRASRDAHPSDLWSGQRNSDLDTRSSLVDIGSEKRRRAPMAKGAYGRKPVPDADTKSGKDSSVRKKLQKTPVKPQSRPPPPPEKPKALPPAPPSHYVPAKPKTPAPAPPTKPMPLVHAAINKPKTVAPSAKVPSTRSQPSIRVQYKAAPPRTKLPAVRSKGPGVVLFQPESLKPVKPRAPLAVLFDPEQTPASRPTSTPVFKKATVNTRTPVKPRSAVEEPENHVEVPQYGILLPRRAVFNGGIRRRSSAAALSLLQEVSTGLNTTDREAMSAKVKPVVTVAKAVITIEPAAATIETVNPAKPNPPAPRSMEVKKSSKKVFCQGRPVTVR